MNCRKQQAFYNLQAGSDSAAENATALGTMNADKIRDVHSHVTESLKLLHLPVPLSSSAWIHSFSLASFDSRSQLLRQEFSPVAPRACAAGHCMLQMHRDRMALADIGPEFISILEPLGRETKQRF